MSKKSELLQKMENVKNLIVAYENNPKGYCYMIGGSGFYIKSVVEAMHDIKTRTMLGAETKADSLLLDIIANNIFPSF